MVRKIKASKLPIIDPDEDDFDDDFDDDRGDDTLAGNVGLLNAFGATILQTFDLDALEDELTGAPEFSDLSLDQEDIADLCGSHNAVRGRDLFIRGAVRERSFDGKVIRAQLTEDGESSARARSGSSGALRSASSLGLRSASSPAQRDAEGQEPSAGVWFEFGSQAFHCALGDQGRGRTPRGCAHVAALMYAWLQEPQSFTLANLGATLELYAWAPELFAGGGLSRAQMDLLLVAWQDASPELRTKIGSMSSSPSPEELEQLQTMLSAYAVEQRTQDFNDLLGRLTLEQLRAMAKRRHWTLRASAKAKAVAELVEHLRTAPLPDSFTPEEEQLVRIENTLWGLEGFPRHQDMLADWQQHGGGNLKRLEQALEGLQNVAVLLPCTGEGMGLHYHWSPFLRSDMLPLLQPNVALIPSKSVRAAPAARPAAGETAVRTTSTAAEQLGAAPGAESPLLPLLVVLDAVLSFAEREPLRMRPTPLAPQSAEMLVGQWPYVPEELEAVGGSSRKRGRAPESLTVPLQSSFTDETVQALAAIAGGQSEYGVWAALMLINSGVLQLDTAAEPASFAAPAGGRAIQPYTAVPALAGETRVDPLRANAWRLLAPDQQLEQLWQLWTGGVASYSELRVALQDKGFILRRAAQDTQFTPQLLSLDMGLARKFVVRVLAMLSPQTWYAWPAFAACIKRLRSSFLYTYSSPLQWWLEHAPSARRYDANIPQQWDAAFLPVLQSMLGGPLRWFGAIEQLDSPAGFRVTPLGAWLFSGGRRGRVPEFAAAAPAADGPPFEWLDETTFRVRATPDAMQTLAGLRIYVEPTQELLTFRLSLPALGRALAQGATLSTFNQAFAAAGLELAAAVQERISALGERTGRLNLYERVTVLELGDDITLRELLATTSLRAHIVHEFSPRLVVVRDEAVDALLAELVKRGHTPLLA